VNSFPATSAHTCRNAHPAQKRSLCPKAGRRGRPFAITHQHPVARAQVSSRRRTPLLKLVAQDESCSLPVTETDVDQWIESQATARFTRSENGVYLAVELVEAQELVGYVLTYYSDGFHHNSGFRPHHHSPSPTPRLRLGSHPRRDGFPFRWPLRAPCRRLQSQPEYRRATDAGKGRNAPGGRIHQVWFDGKEWVNVSWYAMLKEERPVTLLIVWPGD
jgi:hypothetical protein